MQVFMDADNDGNGTLSKEEFEKASIGSGPVVLGLWAMTGDFVANFHGATPLEWAGEASHVFSVGPHHL